MCNSGLVHGIDLVDMERFAHWLADPDAKLRQHFTRHEREYAADAKEAQHLAGCFAAKEAVLKALGLGVGAGIPLSEIELLHDKKGAPSIRLTGRAEQARAEADVRGLVVSLTHAGGLAFASVVGHRS